MSLPSTGLTAELADAFAARALCNVTTLYPFHLQHMLLGAADARPPDTLHPAFHGSYDWHSSVHMHWTLVRLLRLSPGRSWESAVRAHLDARLTPERVVGECAYLAAPERGTFERPYGWAWLLALEAELARLEPGGAWAAALRPLADELAGRFQSYLRRLALPVRSGVHANTAFALVLVERAARLTQRPLLCELVAERASAFYAGDARYPAEYEPSGEDFLSAGLCEALLLCRVLGRSDFASAWSRFAPSERGLAGWLAPLEVADEHDARLVHWHGVNLSRAWCWRQLAPALPAELAARAARAHEALLAASLGAATAGSYAATHWLASFALLALSDDLEL
jgi:hypothetical protein